MPEVVTVDVVVRDRSAKQTLKDVSGEAKRTGTSFGEMAKDSKTLQKQLFDMDIAIRKTAQELERTGDTSLVKTINKQRRELNALVKVRKDVLGIAFGGKDDDRGSALAKAGEKAGASLAGNMLESFSNAISRGGTTFVGAITGLVVAASPFIGASLAAAVLGGSGGLGIAGGIALAAQDQRVKAAASDLGHTFMAEFTRISEPFVAPTVGALQQLENAVVDIAGNLAPEFDSLADHVQPLARAFVELVHNLLPGFKEALKSAEPVLNALGDALPGLGKDLGAMFDMIARRPEGAVAAMHDLIVVVGFAAKAIGLLTMSLSTYYALQVQTAEMTTRWTTNLPEWLKAMTILDELGGMFGNTGDAMRDAFRDTPTIETHLEGVADAAEKAAAKIRDLEKAVEDAFGKQMSFDEAVVHWQKGLRELKQELTDGKRTLSIYTEEGLRNREAMLQQIAAAEQLRQKTFEQTGNLDAANAAYQNNIQTLYAMGRAAGFSKQELDALFAPYINGPRIAITEFQFPGLLAGLEAARELAQLLGSASAAARYRAGDTSGYGGGRASGGYMAPGMTYSVAESGTGVERVKMLRGGGAVVSNMDQWSAGAPMLGGGRHGGGAGTIVLEVHSAGGSLNDLLTQIIRESVRVIGGGSVQKTYGRDER